MNLKRSYCFLTFIFLISFSAFSQTEVDSFIHKHFQTVGSLIGYGTSVTPKTGYQIYFLLGDYSKSFHVPKRKDFAAWYAEPQFNFVKGDNTKKGSVDYEFGLNLGIRNYVKINEGFYFYQMLGSGPHYISAIVVRQVNGFIFSDNMGIGTLLRLTQKNLFLNFQAVFRHISNAGLNNPNGGINSVNFTIGLSKIK